MESTIQLIKEKLQEPLPGFSSQIKMAHFGRTQKWTLPENYKKAAVLILLYEQGDSLHTVLMRRTSRYKNDSHSGQVSFPGGKHEQDDISLGFTALREANEEIGVPIRDVEILGELSELYIPVSNFLVYPYIGFLRQKNNFIPQPTEVQELIETPFEHLFKEETRKKTELNLPNGLRLNDVPYFDVKGNIVWGATSMIISEMVDVLEGVF